MNANPVHQLVFEELVTATKILIHVGGLIGGVLHAKMRRYLVRNFNLSTENFSGNV